MLRGVLLGLAAIACAGCGAGNLFGQRISLQEVPGNARPTQLYGITVTGDRRAEVTRVAWTWFLKGRKETMVITHATGTQSLGSSQRRQLRIDLRQVNIGRVAAIGITFGCYGLPIGDVSSDRLSIGQARTNCPPPSARPSNPRDGR